MLRERHKRTAIWGIALAGVGSGLFLISVEDRATGPFQVRPAARAEVRAPVAGFIREIYCDEGDRVPYGSPVARLDVPDLASRLLQKQAEVREARARLRLLEAGTRPEERAEQRRRVERAIGWRDRARQDLVREHKAYEEDLARLDKQAAAHTAELEQARMSLARTQKLAGRGAASPEELDEAEAKCRIYQAQREASEAEKRASQAKGTLLAETELAKREKELADARSTLALMEAGSRPEEVEAERAKLARLEEENRYLGGLLEKLVVASPVGGLVTTARLHEKVGQYVKEGDLIGTVEEPAALVAEITLAEQDVVRVQPGQAVKLKARAMPFQTFRTEVDRIAPAAGKGEAQSNVTVYCRLDNQAASLRPGMSGHARIATGTRSPGLILVDRTLRYLRTEFWW
jgi:HlyD family secretion protein